VMTPSAMVARLEQLCRKAGIVVRKDFLGEDTAGDHIVVRGKPTVLLNTLADDVDLVEILLDALARTPLPASMALEPEIRERLARRAGGGGNVS